MQRLASVTTTTTTAAAATAAAAEAAATTTMTTAVITNDDPIGDWREGAQRREKGRRARSVPIDERAYISRRRFAQGYALFSLQQRKNPPITRLRRAGAS